MGTKKQNDADVSRRDFLKQGAAAGVGASALAGLGLTDVAAQGNAQRRWDLTADFVTIGAGVSGLAAAVSALEHGASVIMVEENFDIGGHGMVSGGNVHLGGGTSRQRKHGVQDSADQVFQDWVRFDHAKAGTATETWCVPLPTKTRRPLNFWWQPASNFTTRIRVRVRRRLFVDRGLLCSGPSEANS